MAEDVKFSLSEEQCSELESFFAEAISDVVQKVDSVFQDLTPPPFSINFKYIINFRHCQNFNSHLIDNTYSLYSHSSFSFHQYKE